MRVVILGLALVFSTMGSVSFGQTQCLIFDAFNKLYATQMRLSNPRGRSYFDNDIGFLKQQLRYLPPAQIRQELENTLAPDQWDIFQSFLTSTRVLARIDNAIDARTYLANPDVQSILSAVDEILEKNECDPLAVVTPVANSKEVPPLEQFKEAVKKAATPTRLILILLGAIGAFLLIKFIRKQIIQNTRRAKRFRCQFSTKYKYKDKIHDTTVIDISGKGTKIGHDVRHAPALRDNIQVKLLDEWHVGRVRWTNAHYSGVTFLHPLKRRTVRRILKRAKK